MATAEALIAGPADQPTGLKLLLKCRPGHTFTPQLVTTVARLSGDALPGLPPEALLITDAAGTVLYAQGQVQAETLVRPQALSPWVWLLAAGALAVVAAAVAAAIRPRRPVANDWWQHLTARQQVALLPALAQERPEVIALVLGQLPSPVATRLRRQLARRQVAIVETDCRAEPQVAEVVMRAVRSRL